MRRSSCASILCYFVLLATCAFPFACLGIRSIPPEWNELVQRGDMLATTAEPKEEKWMPAVANGYIGTLVGSNTTYISGVYNGRNSSSPPFGPSHRARIPATSSISISNAAYVASALDMSKGVFYRRMSIAHLTVELRWYAHRMYPHLLAVDIAWWPRHALRGDSSPIDASLRLNSGSNSSDIAFDTIQPPPHLEGLVNVWNGSIRTTEEPQSQRVAVAVVSTRVPHTLQLSGGGGCRRFLTSAYTSLNASSGGEDALSSAVNRYAEAVADGTLAKCRGANDTFYQAHVDAWARIWDGGIEVAGDVRLAAAINASLYAILSSTRVDWPYGVSPGGIATDAYNGHVFWDMETWMYPTILMLHPDMARNMLQYRLDRLDAAREKATYLGFDGAMFPWESAFTGRECCPSWAPEGRYEQHVSGDVLFAFRQYHYVTADLNWLKRALPTIQAVAAFWADRVVPVPGSAQDEPRYGIYNVMPPDESAGVVNNSFYTNVIAGLSLQFAINASVATQQPLNKSTQHRYQRIASNMYLPSDEKKNIFLEYDGYDGEMINQADVVLGQYPLMMPWSEQRNRQDILYYTQKTRKNGYFTGDSAYSIAWLALGNTSGAQAEFSSSWAHIKPPFDVWNERVVGGHPHFITGAGGFLQNILFGYAGLRVTRLGEITLDPRMPPGNATLVRLRRMKFFQASIDVTYDVTGLQMHLAAVGSRSLSVEDGKGVVHQLSRVNETISLPLGRTVVRARVEVEEGVR